MSENGYTRITLRIPDALHAKLTDEASRTSKSMNSEIIARLEASFDPVSPTAAGSEVDVLHTILQSTNGLLHVSAHYLKELLERLPAGQEDELFLSHIRNFAEHLHADNLPAAAEKLQAMIALGLRIGAIDPNTGKPKKPKEK